MVANLQTSIPSQDFGYKAEQVMVARLNFDSPATVNIGGLPANAMVTDLTVTTQTAFNAGTNNNLNIGFTDPTATNATAYVSAQAIGPVGVVVPTLPATAVPLSRPTTVTAQYAQTGTPATAGTALIALRFVVP
jgi:hypothetical protein